MCRPAGRVAAGNSPIRQSKLHFHLDDRKEHDTDGDDDQAFEEWN
jgi:hypothetical protein